MKFFDLNLDIESLSHQSYLLLNVKQTDRSQFEPKVNSVLLCSGLGPDQQPTTSIKSFNDCLTGVEELESEMMSMKMSVKFLISWNAALSVKYHEWETGGREGVHTWLNQNQI